MKHQVPRIAARILAWSLPEADREAVFLKSGLLLTPFEKCRGCRRKSRTPVTAIRPTRSDRARRTEGHAGPPLASGLAVECSRESFVLSGLGAVCGLVVAWWGMSLLRGAIPGTVPRVSSIALNSRVLWFAVSATVATGLSVGILPGGQAADVRASSVC